VSATPRFRQPAFLGDQKPGAQAAPAQFERLPRVFPSPPRSRAGTPPAPPEPTAPLAPPTAFVRPPEPPAPAAAPVLQVGSPLAAMMPAPSAPTPAPSMPPPAADTRRLTAAVESLRLEAGRLAEQARADALEIGFQVARRILELELAARPEPLFSLVRSAVRRLGDARHLVIKLHPEDAQRVGSEEGRQKLGLTLMKVEVAADASLERGDCVIESENATVDGRLSTRLDELKRGVESALAEPEARP
jgi:flagellar assembly protein FliH